MCGHATLGTLWLLSQQGRLAGPDVRIETLASLLSSSDNGAGSSLLVTPHGEGGYGYRSASTREEGAGGLVRGTGGHGL